MTSFVTGDFRKCFRELPDEIQKQARKAYKLWRENSAHSSLRFKCVNDKEQIYAVRVGRGWRALGLMEGDAMYWFWIGSHAEYDKILSQY